VRRSTYDELVGLARAASRSGDAEDLLHDALIAALAAGRDDLSVRANRAWLYGTIRNLGRMAWRGQSRRKRREREWAETAETADAAAVSPAPVTDLLRGLRPPLKAVAALVLTGHSRREIAYLLGLSDAALRQRLVQLKRGLSRAGLTMPGEPAGLNLDLAYGRLRAALLPLLLEQGGALGSHDPDGHIFVITRSRNGEARQSPVHAGQSARKERAKG